MRILVTGSDGQLGRALQEVLPKEDCFFMTRQDFDITDEKQTVQQITDVRPEIVIHTAAYTDVDGCEKNPELAERINVIGTENVAKACQRVAAIMFYISTDYVFDGRKGVPYQEKDEPHPLSIYGKTKLKGEEVAKKLPKYFIIRTAWLFGPTSSLNKLGASRGKRRENFVQTILGLAKEKKEIKVVNDQIGCPTYALDLAKAIWQLIQRQATSDQRTGIYHITNSGSCSWYEFAKEIIELKGLKTKVIPIASEEWQKIKPNSAKRPKYSVLDCSKIKKLGIKMPPWQEALKKYLTHSN